MYHTGLLYTSSLHVGLFCMFCDSEDFFNKKYQLKQSFRNKE